jgi:hypothetical protein
MPETTSMSLTNYRDVSKAGIDTDAGFQFEFNCGNCSHRWTSPYKPYRRGQLAGLIYKFAYFLDGHGNLFRASDAMSSAGEKRAREAALQEAIGLAQQRYTECPVCRKFVCEDCWNARAGRCEGCQGKGGPVSRGGDSQAARSGGADAGAVLACPNCQSAFGGGRFCAECGFDMASTHKSCPGCGTMCTRAARFCPDCGHGF